MSLSSLHPLSFIIYPFLLLVWLGVGCGSKTETEISLSEPSPTPLVLEDTEKTIHVFVALCDNDSQGIVPVPKALGKGDDPKSNLYWGAMYGVKTFMKKSPFWEVTSTSKDLGEVVMERIVFKHKSTGAYLIADAYRGSRIKTAMKDFLDAASGNNPGVLKIEERALGTGGKADLVAYIGHNGLMDFRVQPRAAHNRFHGRRKRT